MKHFGTMLVGLGIGLGGVVLGSLPSQPTVKADETRRTVPVAVENTPTVNVRTLPAITGAVSITGQPVSVNVNTLPAVQLAPGTTVGVTGANFSFSNTADTPIFVRDKDNPALAPFQTTLCISVTTTPACGIRTRAFTVPAGQRAVIEYISNECFSNGGQVSAGNLQLETTVGGVVAVYALNPGQQDIFGNIITNQQTRIYADPGTGILMGGTGTGTGIAGCNMVLSGYLVTL